MDENRVESATLEKETASPEIGIPSSKILEGLNPAQKEAVLHDQGPLLIVAGAGTGKTTVLTRRIAYLIASKKALPSQILALTFTDRAAQQMEERIDRLIPYGFNDVWISTFHSFGDRILREYAFDIGLSSDLKVLTLPEAVVLVRQNLFKFKLNHYRPLADPTRFIEALLFTFSRAKDEEISPEEFLGYAETLKNQADNEEEREESKKTLEVAEAYRTYEELKTQMGLIDFGDQVLLCLKIFQENPSILRRVQDRFNYILVDEFQDTNYAQFKLLKMISELHKEITVVGDDDQSIYKFRGACLSNILGFRKTYPQAKEVVLQENYRSTQEILDSAYKLIQHNNPDRLEYRDNLSKSLLSQKGNGAPVRAIHFDTLFSESEFVANEIKKRVDSNKNQPKDFAILVRTNGTAEPFIKSLNWAGLPWQFSGDAGLYEQEEVRTALSFLRTIDQPDDSASLYYLAVSFLYELEGEESSILTQLAAKTKRPLYEVFKDYSHLDEGIKLSSESEEKIKKILFDIKKYRTLSTKIPVGNLLYAFFEERGVLKKLAESTDDNSLQQAQNLYHFFEMIKKFSQVSQYDRVHHFIQYVESLRTAGDDPASAEKILGDNAVSLLTLHAAKGLEFPIVFLVGLEQGHFPLTNRGEAIELPEKLIKDILPSGNFHLQEERRLFFVGLTRAQQELFLCSAKDLGKKKVWKSSQFVLECLDKPVVNESLLSSSPFDSLKIFSKRTLPDPPSTPSPISQSVHLPATAIENYLTCPLKYKFAYVLKIPVLMHHTAVFGVAIHEALKAYHFLRKEKKKMKLDHLLEVFKKGWRSEGFLSREHEEKRFQEGLRVLKSYFKQEELSQTIPTLVEEDFRMGLDRAQIRGRWDRVDINESESLIIDYKTGDVKDQKEADKKAKESVQLALYALAFKNRFGKLPERTVLNFLKKGFVGSSVPTEERMGQTLQTIKNVVSEIHDQQFQPKSGYHCRWCAFEKICPAVDKNL